MSKTKIAWFTFGLLATVFAAIQFGPSPPVQVPAELPIEQREAHRLLNFEGIANFRDLGGYPAADGRRVRWGELYRSGTLAHASNGHLDALDSLGLSTMVDFRSTAEKQEEPDRLPQPTRFDVVEIPTLDEGNKAMVGDSMRRIETGDFNGFDPHSTMLDANRQFATEFTPQYREFIATVIAARGEPVLWHCSAGKDRAGFAAAILLRILGVPEDVVMRVYMASRLHALEARKSQLIMMRLF